jgi:hypothetical protein
VFPLILTRLTLKERLISLACDRRALLNSIEEHPDQVLLVSTSKGDLPLLRTVAWGGDKSSILEVIVLDEEVQMEESNRLQKRVALRLPPGYIIQECKSVVQMDGHPCMSLCDGIDLRGHRVTATNNSPG